MLYSALQRLMLGLNLLSVATALPSTTNTRASADCNDYTIFVTVTSENLQWAHPPFKNNYDVAQFTANNTRRDVTSLPPYFAGKRNETATYKISATFCAPASTRGGTVLIASHGLGFKDYAVAHGYSVLIYDRLGTGKSDKISGYINQAPIQIAILEELTKLVRDGQYTGNAGKPSAIVLIGHSYGSGITNALIASNPTIADAATLTGMEYASPNNFGIDIVLAFGLRVASTQAPPRFADRDTGYLTWPDVYQHAELFFHQPNYEPDVLNFAEDIKMPFGVAELFTFPPAQVLMASSRFSGPVLVLNTEFDFGACSGYCPGLESSAEAVFTGSKKLVTATHPGGGHGMTFGKNATGAYGVMIDFVKSSGF